MLTIQNLNLTQQKPRRIKEYEFAYSQLEFEVDYEGRKLIGIDPGVNWGMTLIYPGMGYVLWGSLPGKKQLLGVRGFQARHLMQVLDPIADISVVEGAAYGKKYGQELLAEIRAGFYLGLADNKCRPYIIPPATIKAKVLGSGRAQAGDNWPWLNHNAADSISICLYGQYLEVEPNEMD